LFLYTIFPSTLKRSSFRKRGTYSLGKWLKMWLYSR